jgi:hypothetical protein
LGEYRSLSSSLCSFLHSPVTSFGPHPMKIEIRHSNVWTPPINTYWFESNHEPGLRETGQFIQKLKCRKHRNSFVDS